MVVSGGEFASGEWRVAEWRVARWDGGSEINATTTRGPAHLSIARSHQRKRYTVGHRGQPRTQRWGPPYGVVFVGSVSK